MKTVIQENLIIRIIKILFSVFFLLFLFMGTKSNESKTFLIVFYFVCITVSLLCFISTFHKIEITNEKIVEFFIVPIKQIDRHSVIDIQLQKKKDGTYDILFSMRNDKSTILHVGTFFSIKEVIDSLNKNQPIELSEKKRKELKKVKIKFYAKIFICLFVSLLISFISIFLISCFLHVENRFLLIIIMLLVFGVIFLGFLYLFLKTIL